MVINSHDMNVIMNDGDIKDDIESVDDTDANNILDNAAGHFKSSADKQVVSLPKVYICLQVDI
jgi:hypothetical protein